MSQLCNGLVGMYQPYMCYHIIYWTYIFLCLCYYSSFSQCWNISLHSSHVNAIQVQVLDWDLDLATQDIACNQAEIVVSEQGYDINGKIYYKYYSYAKYEEKIRNFCSCYRERCS